jgi:hypothetical protein
MRTSHSRSVLAVTTVCAAATWASAQVRVFAPARPPAAFATFRVSVETVVAHVLKFDANGDGRVRAGELPERMVPLIGRGDRNGDQALDADELAAVVRNPLPQGRGRIVSTPVRTDQRTEPFRAPPPRGPEGLIGDLKLPPSRATKALAVLAKRRATGPTFGGVLAASDVDGATLRTLAGILTDDELADFKAALVRQRVVFRGRGAAPPPAPPPPPPPPR